MKNKLRMFDKGVRRMNKSCEKGAEDTLKKRKKGR